jgi:hypothetical protein
MFAHGTCMHLVKVRIPFTEFNYVSEVHQITKKAGPHYDGGAYVKCVREVSRTEDIGLPSARRMRPATWSSLFYAKYSS